MSQNVYKIQMLALALDICNGWLALLSTTGREQERQLLLASACSPARSLSSNT